MIGFGLFVPAFILAPLQDISTSNVQADAGQGYRCPGATFAFPISSGWIGWVYRDPESLKWHGSQPPDYGPDGKTPIIHSGVDFWPTNGPGAPVYAIGNGQVSSRPHGNSNLDIDYDNG